MRLIDAEKINVNFGQIRIYGGQYMIPLDTMSEIIKSQPESPIITEIVKTYKMEHDDLEYFGLRVKEILLKNKLI